MHLALCCSSTCQFIGAPGACKQMSPLPPANLYFVSIYVEAFLTCVSVCMPCWCRAFACQLVVCLPVCIYVCVYNEKSGLKINITEETTKVQLLSKQILLEWQIKYKNWDFCASICFSFLIANLRIQERANRKVSIFKLKNCNMSVSCNKSIG